MSVFQLEAGRVINREFLIERPLSAGGMGAVFVALQQSTGVQRALKVMHPSIVQDPKLRERFAREARVGGSIPSDHVVQVISAGIDEATDLPYLVMELLAGQSLAERVAQRGPIDPATFAVLSEQLCHALGAAHQLGIVHRDLKPENLFLARSRTVGMPFILKVLDFGIAKIVADSNTRPTQAIGTPLWMAPEQTTAGVKKIGPPTDVWALGPIAFYCLTGKHYWRSAEDEELSLQMVLREMLVDELVAPEERAKELGVTLPAGFAEWFRRCVQREPTARFADASLAQAELRRCLNAPAAGALRVVTEPMPPPARQPLEPTAPMPPAARQRPPPLGDRPAVRDAGSPATDAPHMIPPAPRGNTTGARRSRVVAGALGLSALVSVAVALGRQWSSSPAVAVPEHHPPAPASLTPVAPDPSPPSPRPAPEPQPPTPEPQPPGPTPSPSPPAPDPQPPAPPPGPPPEDPIKRARETCKRPASTAQAKACETSCAAGGLSDCLRLGEQLDTSAAPAHDQRHAVELYRKACDGGEATGCFRLGRMYANATGVTRDEARAVELYRKACDAKVWKACNNLGWMYDQGQGVTKDFARAVELYRAACEAGVAKGCGNLAAKYDRGEGVTKDQRLAMELHRRGCDAGEMISCNQLGFAYATARGVSKDSARAVELFRKACEGGEIRGCGNLGLAYELGEGVARDSVRAGELYRKACNAGDEIACDSLRKSKSQ